MSRALTVRKQETASSLNHSASEWLQTYTSNSLNDPVRSCDGVIPNIVNVKDLEVSSRNVPEICKR